VNSTEYGIQLPGDYNIANALAAIALALQLDIPADTIKTALAKFTGTWRRFEIIGQYHNAIVISDYAHHPTAIKGLLKAANDFYPNRRKVIAFQPHQHNRTRRLFDQFTQAFNEADVIIIQEIFDVVGREEADDQTISSQDLVNAINLPHKTVLYSANQTQTKQLLQQYVQPNDVVLIAGAGDIYTLPYQLCSLTSH
jgi:UDP-N-acetylmuramate--alanine ligase